MNLHSIVFLKICNIFVIFLIHSRITVVSKTGALDKNVKKENPKKEIAKEEKVEVVKENKEEKADLTKLTVAELRDMAKAKEVKGYSTMKKAELLEALK